MQKCLLNTSRIMASSFTMATQVTSLREKAGQTRPLQFYDTLRKTVRTFELEENQTTVRWYSCGPTVYDASHMGHARNYVTTDILRRLLKDYFGYDLKYVQNVTDVDDKIIVKARHNLLFDKYCKAHAKDLISQRDSIATWWKQYRLKMLPHVSTDIQDWANQQPIPREPNAFPKDQMAIDTLTISAQALQDKATTQESFWSSVRDVVIFGVDKPDQVLTNEEIFESSKQLTTYWEAKFDEDMQNLNVLKPDTVVRVTEFMDTIVSFVQTIVKNGFAYEVGGSVYFDVAAFIRAGHDYAKLKPSSMASSSDALLAEAEGSLSDAIAQAKKSQRDFALWKASKAGEPYWQSPWGLGRPGWHIECSAMASSEFGCKMDIHSGGEDLTFPHHDNELAQSEAAHGCHEWVRYFMHTGHLHIHGMKMSKSLKNFITIEQVLTTEGMTSRTMRLLFLSGKWRGRVDYNEDLIRGVRNTEQKFTEFFTQIRALAKEDASSSDSTVLSRSLQRTREEVDAALANDFDTPSMLASLRELLSEANKSLSSETPSMAALLDITAFFTDIFEVVGITAAEDRIGWQRSGHGETVMREVTQIAIHRQQIRELSIKSVDESSTDSMKDIVSQLDTLTLTIPELVQYRQELVDLVQCKPPQRDIMEKLDAFRDDTLVNLGIALDDKKDSFILKSSSKEELVAKRDAKLLEAREKLAKKEQAKKLERETMMKGEMRASDMFRREGTIYTQFDARGIPTHLRDEQGQETEVSKSLSKKLAKEYTAQEKLNRKYDEWILKQ